MNRKTESLDEIKLIGLDLGRKTTNEKSGIDCGNLWKKFENGNYAAQIPNKTGDDIYAVYYDYEGDHTDPFGYFIGCKVTDHAVPAEGLNRLTIPGGAYLKITAKGRIPDCIINTWKEIWASDIQRSYTYDFEIYGERSKDWNNAEIDVFLS